MKEEAEKEGTGGIRGDADHSPATQAYAKGTQHQGWEREKRETITFNQLQLHIRESETAERP